MDLNTWLVVANGCAWVLMAGYVGVIVSQRAHTPSRVEMVVVLAAFWLVTWGGLARRLKAADLVIGVAWTAVSVALAYGLARALTRRNQPPPAI